MYCPECGELLDIIPDECVVYVRYICRNDDCKCKGWIYWGEEKEDGMFIAYVVQEGKGCDYTIACGETLWELKAQTEEEALAELRGLVLGEEGCPDLATVILYKVSKVVEVDLSGWYADAAVVEQEEVRQERFEQYKRLQAEFAEHA